MSEPSAPEAEKFQFTTEGSDVNMESDRSPTEQELSPVHSIRSGASSSRQQKPQRSTKEQQTVEKRAMNKLGYQPEDLKYPTDADVAALTTNKELMSGVREELVKEVDERRLVFDQMVKTISEEMSGSADQPAEESEVLDPFDEGMGDVFLEKMKNRNRKAVARMIIDTLTRIFAEEENCYREELSQLKQQQVDVEKEIRIHNDENARSKAEARRIMKSANWERERDARTADRILQDAAFKAKREGEWKAQQSQHEEQLDEARQLLSEANEYKKVLISKKINLISDREQHKNVERGHTPESRKIKREQSSAREIAKLRRILSEKRQRLQTLRGTPVSSLMSDSEVTDDMHSAGSPKRIKPSTEESMTIRAEYNREINEIDEAMRLNDIEIIRRMRQVSAIETSLARTRELERQLRVEKRYSELAEVKDMKMAKIQQRKDEAAFEQEKRALARRMRQKRAQFACAVRERKQDQTRRDKEVEYEARQKRINALEARRKTILELHQRKEEEFAMIRRRHEEQFQTILRGTKTDMNALRNLAMQFDLNFDELIEQADPKGSRSLILSASIE